MLLVKVSSQQKWFASASRRMLLDSWTDLDTDSLIAARVCDFRFADFQQRQALKVAVTFLDVEVDLPFRAASHPRC